MSDFSVVIVSMVDPLTGFVLLGQSDWSTSATLLPPPCVILEPRKEQCSWCGTPFQPDVVLVSCPQCGGAARATGQMGGAAMTEEEVTR